jgi:hypothetical protein
MANVRLVTPNLADDATLSASPAMVAALPQANLQDPARARTARSVGLPSPQYVRGNWSASSTVNCAALVRHNLSGGATVRFKLWSGLNQTGTLVYDSGAITLGTIIPYGEYVYGVDVYGATLFQDWPVSLVVLWFAQVIALSFELQMNDPSNSAGYMEASRLVVGNYFAPARNFSYGHKFRWEDDSTQERADGGTLRTDTREPYRVFRFNLDWLDEAARATLANKLRDAGKTAEVFVAMYPDDAGTKGRDYTALMKIIQMPDLEGDRPLNYRSELVLAEA